MAISREDFEKKLAMETTPRDFNQIMLAYRLAEKGHEGQKRLDGEDYIEHPKAVALILLEELGICYPPMIISALLHDLIEDTSIISLQGIEVIFGDFVGQAVSAMTKDKSLPKSRQNKEYFEKLLSSEQHIQLLKLADRLHNCRTVASFSPDKRREYIRETAEFFLPMAERVNGYLFRGYLFHEIKKACEAGI